MKIAYLCQSYPPMISGAARAVRQLAEGMAARGHEVLVLAASDRGRAYRTRTGRMDVVRLSALPNPFRVGQRMMLWPGNAMAGALRVFHPDLLHMHDFSPASLAGLRSARALRIPVVLTFHLVPESLLSYLPPWPGLRRIVKAALWAYSEWIAAQCQAVVTPTRTIAEMMSAHCYCRPVVLSNGVELGRFSPQPASPDEGARLRRKYGLDPDLPVILWVGRIDVDKRVEVVIRAAAGVMRSMPAHLLVVGNGTRREAAMRLSEALGIRDRTHFPGYVPATGDLPGLYRLASVFVIASEAETQGLAGLEAAASGVPIVAVRAAAIPELVEDGVTGYLVEPGAVLAMADRVRQILQNPERAQVMGQAARARVEAHALENAVEAHERFYQSLLVSGH